LKIKAPDYSQSFSPFLSRHAILSFVAIAIEGKIAEAQCS